MSSEPIPIAHISKEIQIEEDPLSEEPEEIKDNDESKGQAKSSIVPFDDLISALKSFGGSSSKAGNIGQIQEPEPFLGKCQGTSLAVCTPLYTLLIIHIPPSFYFAYNHLLLFGYDLNLSCSQ